MPNPTNPAGGSLAASPATLFDYRIKLASTKCAKHSVALARLRELALKHPEVIEIVELLAICGVSAAVPAENVVW